MIPTQIDILKMLHTELTNYNIVHWLSSAPKEQAYLFTTYSISSSTLFDYNFNKEVYDDMIIKFSIYNKDTNCNDLLDIADIIEDIMENLPFTLTAIGYDINLCNFNNSIGPRYNGLNGYWEHIIEYRIVASKSIL